MNVTEQAKEAASKFEAEGMTTRTVVHTRGSIRVEVSGGKLGKRVFDVLFEPGQAPVTSKYAYLASFNPSEMGTASE